MKLVHLSVNFTGNARRETMAGRDYIVLPVVILVQGVHNGSGGPVLYLVEDMATYAAAWNHKPIVVNHPKNGDIYVSADSPEVLSASQVGILLKNHIRGDKQYAEAWLEINRLNSVDPRIVKAIERGIRMEVSTGLFATFEEKEGTWNGNEPYKMIAREYRPDHLALLPDQVGACSVQDGCGLFTASESVSLEKMEQMQLALNAAWNGEPVVNCPGIDNCPCKQKGVVMKKLTEAQKKELVDNLIGKSGKWKEEDREWLTALEDARLNQLVLLSATPEPGKKVTEDDEDDDEDEAIANEIAQRKAAKKAAEEAAAKEAALNVGKGKKKVVSLEEYVNAAPPQIREVLTHGLAANAAERKRYIDIILSNEDNAFEEKELEAFDLRKLQKIAALCTTSEEEETETHFNYMGNAGAPANTQKVKEAPLPLPVMNFKKKD